MTNPTLARCGCGGEAIASSILVCQLDSQESRYSSMVKCSQCTATVGPFYDCDEGIEVAVAAWNAAMSRDCLHCEKLEAKIRDPYMEGREDAFEAIVADLRRLGAKYLEQGKPELYAVCDYASRTYDRGKLMTTETEPKGERDVDSRTN